MTSLFSSEPNALQPILKVLSKNLCVESNKLKPEEDHILCEGISNYQLEPLLYAHSSLITKIGFAFVSLYAGTDLSVDISLCPTSIRYSYLPFPCLLYAVDVDDLWKISGGGMLLITAHEMLCDTVQNDIVPSLFSKYMYLGYNFQLSATTMIVFLLAWWVKGRDDKMRRLMAVIYSDRNLDELNEKDDAKIGVSSARNNDLLPLLSPTARTDLLTTGRLVQ